MKYNQPSKTVSTSDYGSQKSQEDFNKSDDKKQDGENKSVNNEAEGDEIFYFIKGQNVYHMEGCPHIKGKQTQKIKKSEVDKSELHFCKDCQCRNEKDL